MTTKNARSRRPAASWRYILPTVGAPVGGGLMKIGHANAWAAISVALAPFAIFVIVYIIFAIAFLPAVICCLCSGRHRQDAIMRLVATSANALVALLTFTPMDGDVGQAPRVDKPELKVLKGGSIEAPGEERVNSEQRDMP